MTTVALSDVQQILGDIDPFTIQRIVQTGASLDEITEARSELEDERRCGEHREPSNPRVIEVREILEELIDEDDDEC